MLRILCLDDNPLITDVMSSLLEELGHQVIGTASAGDALDILRHSPEPFHLLIADIHLGKGMDGRAVAALASEGHPDLRVIHFTGDPGIASDQRDMIVLPKPCTMGTLEAAIMKAFPDRRTPYAPTRANSSDSTAWLMKYGGDREHAG